jgi:acyl-coenzyme A synthetase/AMP-(fatty) acid ligase
MAPRLACGGKRSTAVSRFKRPKRYVFIAELPKNAYSKVLKTVLRQQLTLESPA